MEAMRSKKYDSNFAFTIPQIAKSAALIFGGLLMNLILNLYLIQ